MAKTNRVAWGLAAVLGIVLLVAVGRLVTRGACIGGNLVQVGLTSQWRVGEERGLSCGYAQRGDKLAACGWTNRTLYKGFFYVWTAHLDYLGKFHRP